jgi:hypothetical protein
MTRTIFFIESKETHECPVCGGQLTRYDRRIRYGKQSDGSRKSYKVRRLKCSSCASLHTELPDILLPCKHYIAEVIESQIDGTRDDCPADNSTLHRWLKQFRESKCQIEAMLRSMWSRKHKQHFPITASSSLLENHRRRGTGWLTLVSQILVNAGLWQPTRFACCP